MNRKLFVDKKEINSIFGGKVGRYHGFQNDFKIGGTYEESFDKYYKEKDKRDFKIKKRVDGISDMQTFNLNSSPEPSAEPVIPPKTINQRLNKFTNHNSDTGKLPMLRESASNKMFSKQNYDLLNLKKKIQMYNKSSIGNYRLTLLVICSDLNKFFLEDTPYAETPGLLKSNYK